MRVNRVLVGLGILGLGLLASPANARTYTFAYSGGIDDPGVSGSGTFATNAANDMVVSGSGTFSFAPFTDESATLIPGSGVVQSLSYDNVFPIDDANGLLFKGTTDPSFIVNIFAPTGNALGVGASDAWSAAQDGGSFLRGSLGFGGFCRNCVADGRLTIASVPEPAAWALMLLGFAGLGFAGYRKSTSVAAFAD